jgi:hypothetical protein
VGWAIWEVWSTIISVGPADFRELFRALARLKAGIASMQFSLQAVALAS